MGNSPAKSDPGSANGSGSGGSAANRSITPGKYDSRFGLSDFRREFASLITTDRLAGTGTGTGASDKEKGKLYRIQQLLSNSPFITKFETEHVKRWEKHVDRVGGVLPPPKPDMKSNPTAAGTGTGTGSGSGGTGNSNTTGMSIEYNIVWDRNDSIWYALCQYNDFALFEAVWNNPQIVELVKPHRQQFICAVIRIALHLRAMNIVRGMVRTESILPDQRLPAAAFGMGLGLAAAAAGDDMQLNPATQRRTATSIELARTLLEMGWPPVSAETNALNTSSEADELVYEFSLKDANFDAVQLLLKSPAASGSIDLNRYPPFPVQFDRSGLPVTPHLPRARYDGPQLKATRAVPILIRSIAFGASKYQQQLKTSPPKRCEYRPSFRLFRLLLTAGADPDIRAPHCSANDLSASAGGALYSPTNLREWESYRKYRCEWSPVFLNTLEWLVAWCDQLEWTHREASPHFEDDNTDTGMSGVSTTVTTAVPDATLTPSPPHPLSHQLPLLDELLSLIVELIESGRAGIWPAIRWAESHSVRPDITYDTDTANRTDTGIKWTELRGFPVYSYGIRRQITAAACKRNELWFETAKTIFADPMFDAVQIHIPHELIKIILSYFLPPIETCQSGHRPLIPGNFETHFV